MDEKIKEAMERLRISASEADSWRSQNGDRGQEADEAEDQAALAVLTEFAEDYERVKAELAKKDERLRNVFAISINNAEEALGWMGRAEKAEARIKELEHERKI